VAIDGPAGVGKSTLARRLAEALDLPYVNTGLMYRAVAHRARREGTRPDDAPALAALAERLRFDLDASLRPAELTIDGERPGAELAEPEVESSVSQVARHPEVRAVLRREQRRLSAGGGVVEGRDIGRVVAPDADAKLYLEAEAGERAARRTTERRGGAGRSRAVAERDTARAMAARDAVDAGTNPFEPAPDAVALDTTGMDADEVFRIALDLVRERLDR
jgi:cytidylate kinase